MVSPEPLTMSASSPKPATAAAGASSSSSSFTKSTFTPQMQDRQARGKDPYNSDSEDSNSVPAQGTRSVRYVNQGTEGGDGGESTWEGHPDLKRVGPPKTAEAFDAIQRRRMASEILDAPELLMRASLRDNLSIAAARLKYIRIITGIDEPDTPALRAGITSVKNTTTPTGAVVAEVGAEEQKRNQPRGWSATSREH
ncbi:hypothetical protein F4777DRAFT_398738 [Nemania sp. FL0916]|nr:hypothetical protein F4777DRAFT_398738 [Nemania sp. FL0916]